MVVRSHMGDTSRNGNLCTLSTGLLHRGASDGCLFIDQSLESQIFRSASSNL
jgi:hypothetical protein